MTSSILAKRNLLQSSAAAELFIDVLYTYRSQSKYLLHEFVVMPDHIHVLITVVREMSIEGAVQLIKGGFAFRASRELGFHAPVWQKGFSEIRTLDSKTFSRQREYIRNNPVARHLAERREGYLYSSANSRYELDEEPQRLKPLEFAASFGTPKGVP